MSIRVSRGRATVRTAEHAGFAFDVGPGMFCALSVVIQQLGIRRIRAYGREAAKLAPLTAKKLRVDVVNPKRDFDASSLASAVNLLQGRFAPGNRFGAPALATLVHDGHWRPMLAWASLGLAVYVSGLHAYRIRLESHTHALRAAMVTAFRDAFPSEAQVDPVAQAQRHVRELRIRSGQFSPDDFSTLNTQAAQLLTQVAVGALASVEYRDSALTLKFKPGVMASPAQQASWQAEALRQGLKVRFDVDDSAHLEAAAP
jgi:hypothetical protein